MHDAIQFYFVFLIQKFSLKQKIPRMGQNGLKLKYKTTFRIHPSRVLEVNMAWVQKPGILVPAAQ